jgi:hypothetical protein
MPRQKRRPLSDCTHPCKGPHSPGQWQSSKCDRRPRRNQQLGMEHGSRNSVSSLRAGRHRAVLDVARGGGKGVYRDHASLIGQPDQRRLRRLARIFSMTRPRCTLTVFSPMPRAAAICLFSLATFDRRQSPPFRPMSQLRAAWSHSQQSQAVNRLFDQDVLCKRGQGLSVRR